MSVRRLSLTLVALALSTGALAGCAPQEKAARAAVAAAEVAFKELKQKASQYAPRDMRIAEEDLNALKGELDRGRFDSVVAAAPKYNETLNYVRRNAAELHANLSKAANAEPAERTCCSARR